MSSPWPSSSTPAGASSIKGFAIASVIAILLFVIATAVFLPHSWFPNTIPSAPTGTLDGPKEAMVLLKDTTLWLASIQTATLAALGFMTKEGITALKPTLFELKLSILVAVSNASALFFSAWVLTSLPSVMLRVQSNPTKYYDFFNLPIYPFLEAFNIDNILTVQFFAFCNHWLWALGVLLFGWLCVSMAISRSHRTAAGIPRRTSAEDRDRRPRRSMES